MPLFIQTCRRGVGFLLFFLSAIPHSEHKQGVQGQRTDEQLPSSGLQHKVGGQWYAFLRKLQPEEGSNIFFRASQDFPSTVAVHPLSYGIGKRCPAFFHPHFLPDSNHPTHRE